MWYVQQHLGNPIAPNYDYAKFKKIQAITPESLEKAEREYSLPPEKINEQPERHSSLSTKMMYIHPVNWKR